MPAPNLCALDYDVYFTPTTSGTYKAHVESVDGQIGSFSISAQVAMSGVGPDLTGSFLSLSSTCTKKCSISGMFRYNNLGTADTKSLTVQYYLSETPEITTSSVFLKKAKTGKLRNGTAKDKKLKFGLKPEVTASGKYVLCKIDALEQLAEADESNNLIIYGPLP